MTSIEERAAILEHEAGFPRAEAEKLAREMARIEETLPPEECAKACALLIAEAYKRRAR